MTILESGKSLSQWMLVEGPLTRFYNRSNLICREVGDTVYDVSLFCFFM